jgi:hypothetical protein
MVHVRSRRQVVLRCLYVALTALMCAGLLSAAALVPAPPAVLPFLVVIGVGCPMVAACELPGAVAGLRATRRGPGRRRPRALDEGALETLRRQLDGLPETRHPLDL